MPEIFQIIAILLLVGNLFTTFYLAYKIQNNGQGEAFYRLRQDMLDQAAKDREELRKTMTDRFLELNQRLDGFAQRLNQTLANNENKMVDMRKTLDEGLQNLQKSNEEKLEKMRQTVDEKLQSTLERRLTESFARVSDQLAHVQKGLGEMQELAKDVGDLQKVLTNVKTRGNWGEIQLEALLLQILVPEQYEKNCVTKKGSQERVEFAIKLPGRGKNLVYLPIDAKFPQEDYQRMMEAKDADALKKAGEQLENRIKNEAKDISKKYINPPYTTDFAIMFLPVEGLYAEVLKRPGLCETLQRDFRVVVAGPTTLAALLNSLQMGFKTLAIEKRSSEVWKLLGEIKYEFGVFSQYLERTQKKLQEAGNAIEDASRKTRVITRKLKNVEVLPELQREVLQDGEEEEEA